MHSFIIRDVSGNNKNIAVTGNAMYAYYSVGKFGAGCWYYNGGDLTIADTAGFDYGTGDFTIEMWINHGAITSGYLIDHGSGNSGAINITSGKYTYYNSTIGTSSLLYTTGGGAIIPDAWVHLAISRAANTTRFFVNGALMSSGTDNCNYGLQRVQIGKYGGGGYSYIGYMEDLRITKGAALYTIPFSPPSAFTADTRESVRGHIAAKPCRADIIDGGRFCIVDTVSRLGVMGHYLLVLFDRRTKRPIRETWSAANGAYAFNNISYRYRGYFINAFDHSGTPVNAAVGDFLTPEPMPS
jgi:hypothetical protein